MLAYLQQAGRYLGVDPAALLGQAAGECGAADASSCALC